MPILLDDIQNQMNTVQTFTPKFFSEKLTGRGGSTAGLLSAKNNPFTIDPKVVTSPSHYKSVKKETRHGNTVSNQIPIYPYAVETMSCLKKLPRPDLSDLVLIGNRKATMNQNAAELYMDMSIAALQMNETKTPAPNGVGPLTTTREFIQCYIVRFFSITDQKNTEHELTNTNAFHLMMNSYSYEYTSNPLQDLQTTFYQALVNAGFDVNVKTLIDYVTTYELYDSVTRASEIWQTTIDAWMKTLLQNFNPNSTLTPDEQQYLKHQMKYLMSYNIPLDLYRNIYDYVKNYLPADMAKDMCKQNLNLLLSDTMNNLQKNKTSIQSFTPPQPSVQLPQSVKNLSPEQTKAVMSTEPLILVQAGAGTGKSTLILGRIDYLVACGINPQDITVLSFTNAAANHIKEKNPNVHSMTIASMIHEIYSANFTGHELSSLDTITNSLDIYYPSKLGTQTPQEAVAAEFKKKCRAMIKNDTNNFTEMNNFIEDNYDTVMQILDTIHQTSLELEIIICYQKINTLIEPSSVSSKYLIMDEVQDNSIFEFVYTLKYIDKHKESLFIVGDCSQTLYEFRASNPRALNILESSKTFATYQLNVNYRSNQEILDFANIALKNIEANQYANIQLQANSLAPVTEQSFLDKVNFNYHQLAKITQFAETLPGILAREIRPYINQCLAKGEQVAFLTFTRRDVANIQNILAAQFPNHTAVSLVPEKMYNSTIISTFIKKYWHEIKFVPTANIAATITQEIMAKLQFLVYDPQAAATKIAKILQNWRYEQGQTIKMWEQQVANGQLTANAFADLLRENMLQHEIKSNAMKQALLSNRNQQAKQDDAIKNANFLLSTIHSAKGLEFDNVVVFYRNENTLAEDKKRMYYVAFTRAMKSEYILAYDTTGSPQIQADYITVLEGLHAKAPAANSPLNKRPKNRRIKI